MLVLGVPERKLRVLSLKYCGGSMIFWGIVPWLCWKHGIRESPTPMKGIDLCRFGYGMWVGHGVIGGGL